MVDACRSQHVFYEELEEELYDPKREWWGSGDCRDDLMNALCLPCAPTALYPHGNAY